MARKYGDQSFKEGEKDNIDEEIADVLWVLLCIANQTGVWHGKGRLLPCHPYAVSDTT